MVVTIEVLNSIRASPRDHSDEEDVMSRRNPALFGDEQRSETGLLRFGCAASPAQEQIERRAE
jgi:hypothetical protein